MEEKVGNGNENNGPETDPPEFGRGVHGRQLVRIEQQDAPPFPGPSHPKTGRLALDRGLAVRHVCFPRSCSSPYRLEGPGSALIHVSGRRGAAPSVRGMALPERSNLWTGACSAVPARGT